MNRYMVNPGGYKHWIELQELMAGINNDNIPVEEWTTIWKTRAMIRDNTFYNKEVEDGSRSQIKRVFITRYPKHIRDFDVENTDKYKIKYKNKIYKIVSMSNINEEDRFLEINLSVWE